MNLPANRVIVWERTGDCQQKWTLYQQRFGDFYLQRFGDFYLQRFGDFYLQRFGVFFRKKWWFYLPNMLVYLSKMLKHGGFSDTKSAEEPQWDF